MDGSVCVCPSHGGRIIRRGVVHSIQWWWWTLVLVQLAAELVYAAVVALLSISRVHSVKSLGKTPFIY
jgi:hypothetical protein